MVIENDGAGNKDATADCETEVAHHHHHVVCNQQPSCVPAPCSTNKLASKPPKGSKERFIARVNFKVSFIKTKK